jgi:hypothetical protein
MRAPLIYLAIFSLFAAWLAAPAAARIISVKPIDGAPGKVIAAPPEVLDGAIASATHMVGFNERQNVLLNRDLEVDGGTIAKGTRVNSHMILFNLPDDDGGSAAPSEWNFGARAENEWVFSGPVLGVMSDTDGLLEAASTETLGSRTTTYPSGAFFLRGFEDNDTYDGVGTTRLRVRMSVWQPGDWIRVITGVQPIAGDPVPHGQAQVAKIPDHRP